MRTPCRLPLALLLAACLAALGAAPPDKTTIGGDLLKELLRHKPVKFENSKLKGHYPRTSIAAGGVEKVVNTFWEQNGSTLGFMLTESGQPSSVSGNAYVHLTKAGGAQSTEAQLADRIAASQGDLLPNQVLGMALDVCGGDYWLATLTCHNLLKEVTYAQRSGAQPLIGWDKDKPDNANRWQLLDASKVTDKLRNLRPDNDKFVKDKMGPWYHMYGLFFVGGMTTGGEAETLAWVENVTRKLGLGSKEDAFKMDMNSWAASLCHPLNALVNQGLYVPANLSTLTRAELQATMDQLRAKHRALQGELEFWGPLVNDPNLGDTAVYQMDVARAQQKAIYAEHQRVRAEFNQRPKE